MMPEPVAGLKPGVGRFGAAAAVAATILLYICFPGAPRGLAANLALLGASLAAALALSLPRIRGVLLSRVAAFTACYAFLLACLWRRFTPSFGTLIWHDDAPMLYSYTLQGLDMLRGGGLFGWDPWLLGGYPAFLDKQYNLALFAWPFTAVFGGAAGFNCMVFCAIVVYPLLAYRAVRSWLPDRREAAVWGIYISGAVLHQAFYGFLGNCSFNSMVGLDCYLLVLIALKAFLDGGRLGSFFLFMALAATSYAHVSFLVLALVTAAAGTAAAPRRGRNAARLLGVCAAVCACALPYAWQMARYRDYFIEDTRHFVPRCPAAAGFGSSAAAALWLLRDFLVWGGIAPVLALVLVALRTRLRPLAAAYLAAALVVAAGMQVTDQAFMRMENGLVALGLVFAAAMGGGAFGGEGGCPPLLSRTAIILLVAGALRGPVLACADWTTPRLAADGGPYRVLIDRIRRAGGNLVLVEGAGSLDHATESARGARSRGWSDDVHPMGVFALLSGRSLFTSPVDGFHPSVFRGNAIVCGTYRGKFLSECGPAEMRRVLWKWGIRDLFLWSDEAKRCFSSPPAACARVWTMDTGPLAAAGLEPVPWEEYRFAAADPRPVIVPRGRGTIVDRGYFAREIRLRGAKKGDRVIVRMNYFPAWKAYWRGRRLALTSDAGRLALLSPADGDVSITLRFPRGIPQAIAALLAVPACLIASRRGWF